MACSVAMVTYYATKMTTTSLIDDRAFAIPILQHNGVIDRS